MALNRDEIIGASDIQVRTISVPEWGGEVCVKRTLKVRERDVLIKLRDGFMDIEDGVTKIKQDADAGESFEKYQLYSVGFALCDESGSRLFNDDEIEGALGSKDPLVIERIFLELGKVFNDVQKKD